MFEAWTKAYADGIALEVEARSRNHESGEFRWFLTRSQPVTGDDGQIIKWFGTSTDIERRKRDEAECERLLRQERAARKEIANVFERITDGFISLDRRLRCT